MDLNVWFGTAGTGKSQAMLAEIKEKMQAQPLGDPIVLIAPTQNTFQLEQAFVEDVALQGSLRTEVLHFERLSYRVFQEIGGLNEEQLSKAATEMLIYDILQQERSHLRLYRSQVNYYGFSEKVYEQIQDFKKYAVTPDDLTEFIESHTLQTRMKDKLHDIAHIYQHLEERIKGNYVSTEDTLQRFISLMPKSDWLSRAEIYIDGFHNFSTLEYQIIRGLVQHCKKVTVLLTTNGDKDTFSLFRKPSEVLTHLEDISNDLGIRMDKRTFTQQQRFSTRDLVHLEHNFDALQPQVSLAQGDVQMLEASTMREEVNEIARRIITENRDLGRRYQDVAILYRDESYAYLLESILPQYDIPYHIDVKRSMTYHPVMEMLRALLEVVKTGWQFEPLMRLLKTNVLTAHIPHSDYYIDLLENFVLERGIYGQRWIDEQYFTIEQFSKMGLKRHQLTEEETETFEKVIQLKRFVIDKILHFEEKLNSVSTARGYATALYETVESYDLPSQLMTQRDEYEVANQTQKAEEIDQIWNGFIQTLDDLVTVFGDKPMSQQRFLELLDIGLEQLEFTMIPQTLDQVSIGTMDLAKVDNKAHVYLLGVNDGSLPQPVSSSSLITDEEKRLFEESASIELSPTSDILQMDEAFVCYIALTRAREQLTLSYSLMSNNGNEREPSPYIDQIVSLFEGLSVHNINYLHQRDPLSLLQHPHQAKTELFEALQSWLNGEVVAETWLDVYQVIRDNDRLNQGLSYLVTALTYRNATVQLSSKLTQDLYGESMHASVSRFEGYQNCPFKHFASHGLKLNERTKYKLENFDLGDIFHQVLRYISERLNGDFKNLDPRKIHQLTTEALNEILPEVQFNVLDSTSYYRYLSRRIGTIVESTLKALKYQGEHSKFVPTRFEAGFRRKPRHQSELQAAPLQTKQGIPINIRGQIDRIDTYQDKEQSFVNVIDYKSSPTSGSLDLTKVYYGLQMQMMTYMDVVLQNKERLGLSDLTKPGGLLYFHVHHPRLSFKLNDLLQVDVDKHFLKDFKLNGLLNDDESVLQAFDSRYEPKFKSDIVPLQVKKDGALSTTSKVANEETIYKFLKHNQQNFVDIASDIMDGHTEVAPLKYNQKLPCEYCQYKPVCHVDGLVDSKYYRTVDETINPLEAIQDVKIEGE
ncbi:helicase-exonuclease AddAB subunit AddB [Staphylococcus sp. SQ8-PEA]|uniref:Helicase-exonuclease AddAB subunit AddB n=1 Tax=Staphylococcus marylandisciuri TaxID=2981529 RepID=A0ABT2QPR8_9STAP|nr:helicase-exonuclease AddAB subunit AddB [Staphylococcus marylandisciuri]MCU5745969.1 helicase-exonuclease AddAB subunit AddB [Staphylococcus marylandisciuri]